MQIETWRKMLDTVLEGVAANKLDTLLDVRNYDGGSEFTVKNGDISHDEHCITSTDRSGMYDVKRRIGWSAISGVRVSVDTLVEISVRLTE